MPKTPVITTLEAHTAGEPLRIVTGGWPDVPGETIVARRAYAREHHDHLRRLLMLEPRGHADMYGALLTPPATPDGDVGVLFMHNAGWSTMCGHGIIALVAVGMRHGLFAPRDPDAIRIDTPAGRVVARLEKSGAVSFINVPSFVLGPELALPVDALELPGFALAEGHDALRCTVAFGGAFYAYVDADQLAVGSGRGLAPADHGALVELGRAIKAAVRARVAMRHPSGDPELEFLYGAIFTGTPGPHRPLGDGVHSRHVCVFADGEVDRSPTGTGVSGRAALLHAAGELPVGEWRTIDSILGTPFDVRVLETTRAGDRPAVVPEVRGFAHATGKAEFWLDADDPLPRGFLLR